MNNRNFFILLIFLVPIITRGQDPMSLREVIETGLDNRYSIRILENDLEIAGLRNSAGNAGMLPSLSLNGTRSASMNTTYQRTFSGDERDISNARNASWNAGVALKWTLFDGFGMFIAKDRLDELESMSETDLRIGIESTVSEITTVYYSIVLQQEVIRVMKEATALSRERVNIARARSRIGAGARPALLQATVDLNADSARLISETTILYQLNAQLNYLLGRDPLLSVMLSDSIPPASLRDFEELWKDARTQGNELMLARQQQRVAELELGLMRSQLYPRIEFGTGFGYSQLSAQTGYLEYNRSFGPSYNVTLSYPLFNGFVANRALKSAEIDLRSEVLRTEDSRLLLRMEMFSLYEQFLADLELIALESGNLGVARENVDVAMEKYRLGAISDIELRETQKKLIDAQYQLLIARFRAKEAETELRRMSGQLVLE